MRFFKKSKRSSALRSARFRPVLEGLESRVVPYALTGNAWPQPILVTLSFVPDGTYLASNVTSNLYGTLTAKYGGSTSIWQKEFLEAAQAWAQQTNINFAVVPDNGDPVGSGYYQQGNPGFGDIRIGGYNFGNNTLAWAYFPPPANNYSVAGDLQFNSGLGWTHTTTGGYNIQTAATHEIGHALGLGHSFASSMAVMYPAYTGYKINLHSDDIAGIRAIYGGARSQDSYDASGSNGSFSTATNLTSLINPTTKTALVTNLDLTTTSDLDYYKFTAPSGSSSTLRVKVQSSGLSLLSPKVTIYASNQSTILGSATGYGQYGTTLNVTVYGISAGQTYYIKVEKAEYTALGTGRYAMTLNMGTGSDPTVPLPATTTPNGNPLRTGGGLAEGAGDVFPHFDDHEADHDHHPEEASPVKTASEGNTAPATPRITVGGVRLVNVGPRLTPIGAFGFRVPQALSLAETTAAAPAPISAVGTLADLTAYREGGSNQVRLEELLAEMPPAAEPAEPTPEAAPAAPAEAPPEEAPAEMVPLPDDVRDACFAEPGWLLGSDESLAVPGPAIQEVGQPPLDPTAAAAGLVLALGSFWGSRREVTEERRLRRRQIV